MKKIIISLLSIACLNSNAMTCHKGDTTLEIVENDVTIKYQGQESRMIISDDTWDGHLSGKITGSDFTITYESHYGCFRNVTYIGPFSESTRNIVNIVNFGTCAGGSTADELCLRD